MAMPIDETPDQLDDHLNRLGSREGFEPREIGFEPTLAETVGRFHAMDDRDREPEPDLIFLRRLEEDLMNAAISARVTRPALSGVNRVSGTAQPFQDVTAMEVVGTLVRSLPGRRIRWRGVSNLALRLALQQTPWGTSMGAGRRLLTLGRGGALGAAVGAALTILFAPQSGDELQGRLADRIRRAKIAGAEAKAAKEEELIRRFREGVDDPDALDDEQAKSRGEAAQSVAALGLGLNAPGALAAQETAFRTTDADVREVFPTTR